MKTSSLPTGRVDDDLPADAESVRAKFHARGQAAWEHYQQTGITRTTDEVLGKLQTKLDARRKLLSG